MKNKYIAPIIFTLTLIVSCQSTLDSYADTPNNPIVTSPDLLLTSLEVSTFASYTGNTVRIPAMFIQQIAGTSEGQFGAYSRYDITEQVVNNDWVSLYENSIESGVTLTQQFPENYDYHNGIAKILLAFNFGIATDLWGDIPFSEAAKAISEKNINPKYDTQEDVIKGIQSLLDDAILLLSKTADTANNAIVPGGNDDLIFEGDTTKWIKIAHLLKARYALRISNRDPSAYDTALASLNNANMLGNEDDMNAIFPNSGGNSKNQWKDFEDNRQNYIKMGAFFVDLMKNSNDPRLPFFAAKDDAGDYSGNTLGDISDLKTSSVGSSIASNTQSIGLATYVEAKFMEAEIYQKKGDNAKTEAAFKAAVEASLNKIVGTVDTVFVDNVITDLSLENIIEQKYIALFSSLEPYNDFRRTGFPLLAPNPEAIGSITTIPVRFPTPGDERLYNKNATVVQEITQPVWWDN